MKHMTRFGMKRQSQSLALIAYYGFASLALPCCTEARSWWALEIPAIDGIKYQDPRYAPASTLLMEDTSFLYGAAMAAGSSIEDHIKSSSTNNISGSNPQQQGLDPTVTYSTPTEALIATAPIVDTTASPIISTPAGSPGVTARFTNVPTGPPVQMVGRFPPHTKSPETAFPTSTAPTNLPTLSPFDQPTLSPINQPTFSPSNRYEAANGSCPWGHILHRVWLFDSVGDGWGSTKLTIKETDDPSGVEKTAFEGTLDADRGVINYESDGSLASASDTRRVSSQASGFVRSREPRMGGATGSGEPVTSQTDEENSFNESVYVCLKMDVCYTATVSGGTFLEETSWEVTRVEMGTGDNIGLVANGVGEGAGICNFSLDGSCTKTCDGTAQILNPSSSPSLPVPSKNPSGMPTATPITPTQSPTLFRTRKPVTEMTVNDDRVYVYGVEEYNRIRNVLLDASPSSKPAIDDVTSPQYLGFEWLYGSNAGGLHDSRLVQRWVLASFYYGAGGDDWKTNTGWMDAGKHECQWHGVSCLEGVISRLELEQNHLRGEIVDEIALWGNDLYVLSLGNDYGTPESEMNRLVMPLPSFLSDLTYLRFLNLEGVGLTSFIPEDFFSSWPHLESLYLNNNDITGSLPQSVSNLSSIEVLWLGGNNLGGPIIPELCQLSTLRDLSLSSNFREDTAGKRGFITTVPVEISQLTNLESLSLANNALSGQVPVQLGDLISLKRLQLSGNFFERQLPTELGKLEMLEELDLSSNWLSSTIPTEYGNMISLTSLSLQSNYKDDNGYFAWGIKGELPTQLGSLKNLQNLDLSDNYLSGSLITELGKLYHLQTLHLQNNFFHGPIPLEYSNCVSMKEIILHNNNIDGESHGMPEEICRLPELELARVDCEVTCSCCLTTC